MILLVSQHEAEHTTNIVTDWLVHKEAQFVRVNGNYFEKANLFGVTIGKDSTSYRFASAIDCVNVKAVWFRRWVPRHFLHWVLNSDLGEGQKHELKDYLRSEFTTLREHFVYSLKDAYCLGDERHTLNKLNTLELAQQIGLSIPLTFVTNNKEDLTQFLASTPKLIVKNIQDMFLSSRSDKTPLASLTNAIDQADLSNLPDIFFPSLFQERVNKAFEIRVFYLEGKCYSMAIFSQLDPQTALDFRNYNLKQPNRNVPYQLPVELEDKVIELMQALQLNTGSIDLIRDTNGNYIFLEVNPVGQFGMVSEPCNYHLEEKVADILIRQATVNESKN